MLFFVEGAPVAFSESTRPLWPGLTYTASPTSSPGARPVEAATSNEHETENVR